MRRPRRTPTGAPLALTGARLLGRAGRWTVLVADRRVRAILPCDGVPHAGAGERVELDGLLLLPGFHDAHVHVLSMARERAAFVLAPTLRGREQLLGALRDADGGLAAGEWLHVRRFDHESMTAGWIPDRETLDRVVGDRPLRLQHRNLRLDVLNSRALARCGIVPGTRAAGVERDDREIPTGRVYQAGAPIGDRASRFSPGTLGRLVSEVSQELLAHGVTAVQDAGEDNGPEQLDTLARLARSGVLRQRLWAMASGRRLSRDRTAAWIDARLVRHVKFAPIESRLALDELIDGVMLARRAGLGVAIHATSEGELAAAVAAIDAARRQERRPSPPSRYRIEHAALASEELVAAVAEQRACVVANPRLVHDAGDGYAIAHGEDERPWLHRLAAWRRAGVPLALASDAPVTAPRPLELLQSARTRLTAAGRTLGAEEAIGLAPALAGLTSVPAALVSQAHRLGTIAPGRLADLVAVRLPDDPCVGAGEVVLTILDGRPVHAAGELAAAAA